MLQIITVIFKRVVLNSVLSNDTVLSLVFLDTQISNYKFMFSKNEF